MIEKVLNWIIRNIGTIIIFVIIVVILAPSFFSGSTFPWLEDCFLFRNVKFNEKTGVIGDTIGGITSPFIGVLSIVLLYITFREQRQFNKTQRSASDWTVLLEMRNTIEEHSKKVTFGLIFPNNQASNRENLGLDDIELLNNLTNNGGQLSLADFRKLYDEMLLISDLCILFYQINEQSCLSDEIKKALKNTIWSYSKKAGRFFVLCSESKVLVNLTINTIGDNPVKYREKQTDNYIGLLKKYL